LLSFLHEEWPSPPLVALSTQQQLQAFPSSRLLGGCCCSCLLWLACLFTVCLRDCSSPTLWGLGHPALFATCLFLFYSAACLLFSLFFSLFFPPGWGSVCPGGYTDLAQCCLWEYHMPLSSPGDLCLPKQSGSWRLAMQEPFWFLRLTWSGDAMSGLGVWRSRSFASSWWFFLQDVSSASLQDFTLGSTLSASFL
jgi:hypothetical protein